MALKRTSTAGQLLLSNKKVGRLTVPPHNNNQKNRIMATYQELKNRALETLKGKWVESCIAVVIYSIIMGAATFALGLFAGDSETRSTFASVVVNLVLAPLEWGVVIIFLRMARGCQPNFGYLFEGFNRWGRIVAIYLLRGIYTFLWTLLLIVPGVVKSYSYALTPYIMEDRPELGYNATIEESMRLMQGNKMRLFLFDLSFIGWFLLCLLTLGFGLIFLGPYWSTARAHFYEELKAADKTAEAGTTDAGRWA